ncbi:hypothetical protein NKJ74_32325, partial [Mesorhizobium sp. M0046]
HKVSTYFGGHLMHQSTQQQKVRGNSRLPSISSSITPSRAAFCFRRRLAAGSGLGAAITAGTKQRFRCRRFRQRLTSGPTPGEQLLRGQSVSPRHRAHGRAGFVAFRHDPRLLLRQPFAPPTGAREHLERRAGS